MAKGTRGRIVQVMGPVVDVEFPTEQLPEIYNGLEIPINGKKLVVEVQNHLGNDRVRTVAMDSTDGLQRGMEVIDTGAPITMPVGPNTLGRIFNVLGEPIDHLGPVEATDRYPIHRSAPPFEEQVTEPEFFETGIKVIDLVAPFTKGGKTGVFSEGPGLNSRDAMLLKSGDLWYCYYTGHTDVHGYDFINGDGDPFDDRLFWVRDDMVVVVYGAIPAMYANMASGATTGEGAAPDDMEVVCYRIP